MQTTHTTVPGAGVLHDCTTRDGGRLRVLVARDGDRRLFLYGPGPDTPVVTALSLEPDEADQLAELLHSVPILDRIAELERRLARMSEASGPREGRT